MLFFMPAISAFIIALIKYNLYNNMKKTFSQEERPNRFSNYTQGDRRQIQEPMPRRPHQVVRSSVNSDMQADKFKLPTPIRSMFLKRSNSSTEMVNLQNVLYPDIFKNTCKLCQNKFQKATMQTINDKCPHIFCHVCLFQYIKYKLNTMGDVRCPEEGCSQEMTVECKSYQDLPQEFKEKYNRLKLWKQTINNPNLKLCPTQNCKGLIQTNHNYTCSLCHTQFCPQCMLKRHIGPCDENFQKNFQSWKRCPKCQMFVEKIEGCNHISCRCEHQFCYVCLSNWTDEHYQCGGRFSQQIIRQNFRDIPRCRRIIFAIILIFLFPFLFVLFTALYFAISLVILALSLIVAPFLILYQHSDTFCQSSFLIPCYLIFLPLVIALVLIVGTIFMIGNYFVTLATLVQKYWFLICMLLQNHQQQPRIDRNNHLFQDELDNNQVHGQIQLRDRILN